MDQERYSIIFSSVTGNTKLLADALRETLPKDACDYFGASENAPTDSQLLYVGFWTDKGNADSATLALLQKLRNKKLFLFGTAGFGISEAYFRKVLDRVMGVCRRKQYHRGGIHVPGQDAAGGKGAVSQDEGAAGAPANLDALIENFDRALPHPDAADLERLKESVLK